MNLTNIKDRINPYDFCRKILSSKICKILEVCERSENLMVFVYLIEKDNFLYCNSNLINNFGKCSKNLWEEGWGFGLSRIDAKEVPVIWAGIRSLFEGLHSEQTQTSYYHIKNLTGKKIYLEHEIFLLRTKWQTLAFNFLMDITDKERIEQCLELSCDLEDQGTSKKELGYISAREQEVLRLIANGFSSKEIANMLFISSHTAISHRKNLIEKFQVKNTAHLVKKAAAFI